MEILSPVFNVGAAYLFIGYYSDTKIKIQGNGNWIG
jgi:hypothetical protein